MKRDAVYLTGFLKDRLPLVSVSVGAFFFLIGLFLFRSNPHHYAFSYLTAYSVFLSMTLGALFFVIIQHLVRAGWSVAIRRIPETLAMNIPLMAILFIPILVAMPELYHWTHAEAVAHDHFLQVKAPYLNIPFFLVRVVIYFLAWGGLAWIFFKRSVAQDQSGDSSITLRLQTVATAGVLIYGLTQTFASFDWIMSVTPHWYSTMFGVYFFAGSILSALAVTVLILLVLKRAGFLADYLRLPHFHDLAKLVYGFNIFWAYISFSQYFLYWYANIPEEAVWYIAHFKGSWNSVAVVLTIGHFFLPFVFFMSKHMRRNLTVQAVVMTWFLAMHVLDLYWVIMPNASPNGIHISLDDVVAFLGIAGLYLGVFWWRLGRQSLVPVGDPRLPESLTYHT